MFLALLSLSSFSRVEYLYKKRARDLKREKRNRREKGVKRRNECITDSLNTVSENEMRWNHGLNDKLSYLSI